MASTSTTSTSTSDDHPTTSAAHDRTDRTINSDATNTAHSATTATPNGNHVTMNHGNSLSATLSPESRRRSNIFGILHSETDAAPHVRSPRLSASPHRARMSLDSLVHQDGDREHGEGFLSVLRDSTNNHASPPTLYRTTEGHLASDSTRHVSLSQSPSRDKAGRVESKRFAGTILDPEIVEEGTPPPIPETRTTIEHPDVDIGDKRQEEHEEHGEGEGADADPEHSNHMSSGEEDEVEIDGAIDGDAEGEPEEDDDEEDDEDSEDEDDEGSIDLEAEPEQDNGDSPVFISMRNAPLGISDLLLPPAADIRVKTEPNGPDEQMPSQGPSSDIVVLGSQAPSQDGSRVAGPVESMNVISIDQESQHAIQPANGHTDDQPPAVDHPETAVNVLVPRPGKKKKARVKSPSPPPAPAPKARVTIRVVFDLFNDDEGPDGKGIISDATLDAKESDDLGVSTGSMDGQGDISMLSTPGRNEAAPGGTDRPVDTSKASEPHVREEPKFRVVNFKEASIAQDKVGADYYIANSGWNAIETDDDEADDDMEEGAGKSNRKKRKFQELLNNGGAAGPAKSNVEVNGREASGSILQAMMGSDEAEMARLAAELDKKYSTTSKPKRKRIDKQDDYDYKDPFIDDTDLQVDQPMIMHRPAKEGFYVQKGAVELISDDEDGGLKKSKGKKQTTLNFGKVPLKDSPVDSDVHVTDQPKKKKKLMLGRGFRPSKPGTSVSAGSSRPSLSHADSGKGASHRLGMTPVSQAAIREPIPTQSRPNGMAKEASPDVTAVTEIPPATVPPPEQPVGPPQTLEEALSRLPEEIQPVLNDVNRKNQSLSEADWDAIKKAKKFPEEFKGLMYAVGKKAVELGLIGDALYDVLPFIIRYNRFTMKKYMLDKMKDYQEEYYETIKRELLPGLKAAINASMDRQVTDYVAQQETYDALVRTEEDSARQEGREPAEPIIPKPIRRVRWSDEMRQGFWRLVKAADNLSNFEAQQAEVHGRSNASSAVQRRNQLYAEILPFFPDGWMSNQQLSRQMSSLKQRYER